jgi:Uma2 family endonuclease
MSATVRAPMSRETFLRWEERQPARFEFDGLRPVAMHGGTVNHARIQANLIRCLGNRLRGGRCEVFGGDLKIVTAVGVRYPDAFVTCGPVSGRDHVVEDPVIVFEIVSPSTAGADRIRKNREYRDTSSIQRYVILEQDQPAATMFRRDGANWVVDILAGDDTLDLHEVGTQLPLSECYEGVDFPPEEADTA